MPRHNFENWSYINAVSVFIQKPESFLDYRLTMDAKLTPLKHSTPLLDD
jgi:hypothetical protein